LSERGGDDAVRVPIEVKTEDVEEIQQLIQELTEAGEEIRKAKTEEKGAVPRRGRAKPDEVSKSPFQAADMDERGGIFGGTMEEAMPQKYKDKTSKTPYQKESAWTDMQNKVAQNQAAIQEQGDFMQGLQGTLGQVSGGIGMAGLAQGFGGILGKLGSMASKAFIPLAIVTTIIEMGMFVINEALKPGGPLDRRFKRDAKNEVANTLELEQKAEINQGFKVVRVSAQPLIRGEAGTTSSYQNRLQYDLGLAKNMQGI
jgi:hypothetical protein